MYVHKSLKENEIGSIQFVNDLSHIRGLTRQAHNLHSARCRLDFTKQRVTFS